MQYDRYTTAPAARRRFPALAAALIASVATVFSTYAVAQITAPDGAEKQENRISDSTQRANPSGTPMMESQKPQSKDAAGDARKSTTGHNKTEGAGGFENGLYGTGAGNNKTK